MRFIPRKLVASLGAVALVGGMALGTGAAGFAHAAYVPTTTESFSADGTSMTVNWVGSPTSITVEAQTQGAFPNNQGTNTISVPVTGNSVTIPVNPAQTYLTVANGVYSNWETSPGTPLAGSTINSVTMGTPTPVSESFTVNVTSLAANTLRGLQWSVDGGTWSGICPVTASTVNGQSNRLVNGVWTIPANAISGTNVIGGIGVSPASGTVWATGSTHTVAIRAYDNAYGADSNTVTQSFTVTPPSGNLNIGIGTGTGTSAPYFGAGAASQSTTDAPGVWVYPAKPIAPGASITQNMLVQNTGDATEIATISGASYTVLPAFPDGGTPAVATAGATTDNSYAMPASWVSAASSVTLTWDQEVSIPVTISVPAGTPDGNYYGVVYATVCAAPGQGINSCAASGVRAYITVRSGS